MGKKRYYVYRYYIGEELFYVGQTIDPLGRFRQHCSDEDVYKNVTKIELTELNSRIDMDMCEVYYINLLKPTHNKKDTSRGEPSFIIQNEPIFKAYTVEEFVDMYAKTSNKKISTDKKNAKAFDDWMDDLPEVDTLSYNIISDMYFKGEFIFKYKGFAVNIAPFRLKGHDKNRLPIDVFNGVVKRVLSTSYWGEYFNSLFSAIDSEPCINSKLHKHHLDVKYAERVFKDDNREYIEDSLTKIKLSPNIMPIATLERYNTKKWIQMMSSVRYLKDEEMLGLGLYEDENRFTIT